MFYFFFYCYGDHPDLHSFPTRRSSDLTAVPVTPLMASKRLVCLSCAARARSNPCSSGWSETLGDRLSGAVTSRGSPPQLYQARTALIPSATDPSGLRDREWDLTKIGRAHV